MPTITGNAIQTSGRGRHTRRARTEAARHEAQAEDQSAQELWSDERFGDVDAHRSTTPSRPSQKQPSIAVTSALNITLNTVRSVR